MSASTRPIAALPVSETNMTMKPTSSTDETANAQSTSPNLIPSTASVTPAASQVTASHRGGWKTAAYIDTKVNPPPPKIPASGSDWIRHEIATHTDPRQTHNRDSNALGQRE